MSKFLKISWAVIVSWLSGFACFLALDGVENFFISRLQKLHGWQHF
jgi:hypothetical protein